MRYDDNIKMFSALEEFDGCNKSNMKCIFDFYRRFSDEIAFMSIFGKKVTKVTYAQFIENSYKCGSFLKKTINEPAGSVVRLALDNSVEWCYAFWGLVMNGFIPYLTSSKNLGNVGDIDIVATVANSQDCIRIDLNKIAKENVKKYKPNQWSNAVYFSSSGTSGGNAHFVSFDTESLVKQIQSAKTFYGRLPSVIYPRSEGKIKNLALLPFYHIFGFVAVFLWYTYFGKTIVFSKTQSLSDICYACKKTKVTHLFAVPAIWKALYARIDSLINLLPPVKQALTKKALNAGIFGDSQFKDKNITWLKDRMIGRDIKLCISGGSYLDPSLQKKFNAVYPLVNGFGMTELGVVAVETSIKCDRKFGTVGRFLNGVDVRLDSGELVVNCAFAGKDVLTGVDYKNNFYTGDIFCATKSSNSAEYTFIGRKKDVYVGENGENLSIDVLEADLNVYLSSLGFPFSLFIESQGAKQYISLAIETESNDLFEESIIKIQQAVSCMNQHIGSSGQIYKVYAIEKLPKTMNGKTSRSLILKSVTEQKAKEIELLYQNVHAENVFIKRLEVFEYVKEKIGTLCGIDKNTISLQDNFFVNCGGNSLTYFDLIMDLENKFGVSIPREAVLCLPTIGELCVAICEAMKA